MRKNIRLRQNFCTMLIITILTTLTIMGYATLYTSHTGGYILANHNIYEGKVPKVAETHAPISISGNLELAAFCTVGSGTSEDPYIIENLEINADSEHGILIENTNLYLVIRNCRIENASSYGLTVYCGLALVNVEHLIIINNEIFNNRDAGIYLSGSNNTVSGNNCSYNEYGIYSNSDYSQISGNNCSYNNYGIYSSSDYSQISDNNCSYNNYGIYLRFSDYSQISGNNCSHNNYGIYYRSNYIYINQISDNTCSHNNYGIYLEYSDNSQISGNNCSYNNYGIYSEYSDNNQISGNNCSYNNYGFYLISGNDNLLWKNIFIENSYSQVFCESFAVGNYWSKYKIGNYWSDYEDRYPDAINDGYIWSEPYHINGTPSDFDSYPLVYQDVYPDTIPPEWVDICYHLYGDISTSFTYDVNATDDVAIDQYWLDNTTYFSIDGNGVITNSTVLLVGSYSLVVGVNDTSGNQIIFGFIIEIEDTIIIEDARERGIAGYSPFFLIGNVMLCIVFFFLKYRNFKTLHQG